MSSILKLFLENFYAGHSVKLYMTVNDQTINEFKNNVKHCRTVLKDKLFHHIFVNVLDTSGFIFEDFIDGLNLIRILTTIQLPHNHRIRLLYVVNNNINYPIEELSGNELIIVKTINECNRMLSKMFKNFCEFCNQLVNDCLLLNGLTKQYLMQKLNIIKLTDEHLYNNYCEQLINGRLLIDSMINNDIKQPLITISKDYNRSLYLILKSIETEFDITELLKTPNIINNIVNDSLINLIMNVNKITYHVNTIDNIVDYKINRDIIKNGIVNELFND